MPFTVHSSGADHFNAIYGPAARSLQEHLSIMYATRSGTSAQGWNTATHENGLVILLPTHDSHEGQAQLNAINPAFVFSRAAAMTYEAFADSADMDDEDQAALPSSLLSAARIAEELAAAT